MLGMGRKKYGGIILEQLKKLVLSAIGSDSFQHGYRPKHKPWSMFFSNLPPKRENLLPGIRMVNWDPQAEKLRLSLNDEVITKEIQSKLY